MNIKPYLKNLLKLVFFFVLGYENKLTAQIPNYIPTDSLVAWWPFNGNANDESGNGNNGTVNGASLTTDRNGASNKAYYFSGAGCNPRIDVTLNVSTIKNGLSIAVWVLRSGNGCYGPRILEFNPGYTSTYGYDGPGMAQWGWDNNYSYGGYGIHTELSNGSVKSFHYGFNPTQNNTWTHLVFTIDQDSVKYYQDGKLLKSELSEGKISLGKYLAIGRMNHPAWDAFNGKLDDMGVWSRALNLREVQNIYNSNISKFNQWSGTGNFTSTSNWISGNIPTSSDSVHVTSGTLTINQNTSLDVLSLFNGSTVKLSAPLTVRNLYLKNGTIDLNGQKLTVTGKIFHSTDSSNYYIQAGTSAAPKPRSEMVINPTSAQNSTIYFNPNANRINRFEIGNGTAAASITLGNSLKIKGGEDGGSGPGLLTIKKNSKVIIPSGSVLTLESDTFNAGLSLSDPAKRAIICQGTGKFAIEREHFGARGWRLYSHPFNANIDLQQVADDIEVIGSGGTSEGFFSNTYTNSSAYWYDYSKADSTSSTDPAWTPFSSAKGTTISGNSNLWNKTSPILLFNPGAVRGSGAFSNPSSATYQEGKIALTYGLDSTGVHLNDGETNEISTNVPNYVPSNGLVGYWPFNGNANDESGNGNHGTVNGANLTTDRNGNSNSAYSFDGRNDNIQVPNSSTISITNDITMSAWVQTSGNNNKNYQTIISKRGTYWTWEYNLSLSYHNNVIHDTKIIASRALGMGNQEQAWSTTSYSSNWEYWVTTISNNQIKIYKNGILDKSQTFNLKPINENCPLLFGQNLLLDTSEQFYGKLDDIAIWNRALTPSEITALYNGTATAKLSSKSQYYFITNPFTTPVKLNRISGLNSTNCNSYFYYWKQRRNAISNNFMPAMWQSELISNGNTDRDTNISIPAFGTILVKLKNPSVAFSIPESAKQLTNFNYIIGGAKGTSSQGLMFQEIPLPKQGPGAVEVELLINDSLPVDRLLMYDKPNEINTFGGADAPKYKDPSFANIYSITTDGKSLSLDAQDISARLNSGEEQVEIPLVIDRDFNKTQKNLRLRIWEKHTDLQCYFKDSKSGNLTPAESFSDIPVEFSESDASIHRYSLVFKRSSTSTEDFKENDLARGGKVKPELIVYPNPANDVLHVRVLNGNEPIAYQIYSLTGSKISEGVVVSSKSIQINQLNPGVYIFKTSTSQNKFIVEFVSF